MYIKKSWIQNSEAGFIYASLRFVIVLFSVPAIYSVRIWYNMNFSHITGFGDYTAGIAKTAEVMSAIWMAGVLCQDLVQVKMRNFSPF